MNSEKLQTRHALANGLFLQFWDLSRPMIGDRCQLVLEIRVAVPITAGLLAPDLRPQLDRIIAALGEAPVFTKQEVRNFVAAGDAASLLKQIEEQLLASLRAYLGHPDFPGKFIRKRYAEHQEEQRCQRR